MLKNMSVNIKGFVAFGLLAITAIGASIYVYTLSTTATQMAENNLAVSNALEEASTFQNDVTNANLAFKNFILTGNRDFVAEYESTIAKADTDVAELRESISAFAAETPALDAAVSTLNEWRQRC